MTTRLVSSIRELRDILAGVRRAGRTIGLVPTMGALHEGHGCLIQQARASMDFVVVSLFVNPIQFNRPDDYQRYPRSLDSDLRFCETREVDMLFAPAGQEMYPREPAAFVVVTHLSEHLCGAFRPNHFRGVATVVTKLFNIVQPDQAFFGEKDAQQLAIIRRLVDDLDLPVQIVGVPTVREPDGLALSSRNRLLAAEERAAAPVIFRALSAAQALIAAGESNPVQVKTAALRVLESQPRLRVEYLEVVDTGELQPVDCISAPVLVACAVWLGSTRLIDSVFCAPPVSR